MTSRMLPSAAGRVIPIESPAQPDLTVFPAGLRMYCVSCDAAWAGRRFPSLPVTCGANNERIRASSLSSLLMRLGLSGDPHRRRLRRPDREQAHAPAVRCRSAGTTTPSHQPEYGSVFRPVDSRAAAPVQGRAGGRPSGPAVSRGRSSLPGQPITRDRVPAATSWFRADTDAKGHYPARWVRTDPSAC